MPSPEELMAQAKHNTMQDDPNLDVHSPGKTAYRDTFLEGLDEEIKMIQDRIDSMRDEHVRLETLKQIRDFYCKSKGKDAWT